MEQPEGCGSGVPVRPAALYDGSRPDLVPHRIRSAIYGKSGRKKRGRATGPVFYPRAVAAAVRAMRLSLPFPACDLERRTA